MSIKNSFKMMLNRFSIVGEILLFLIIFLVVFCGLGAIYIQPVIQAAVDLHLNEEIINLYDILLSGSSFGEIIEGVKGILKVIGNIFVNDKGIVFKTFVVPILFFVTFNLFANMYELALCKVLEARMSSNAKLSLLNNVVSLSGKSVLYVLVKLLFAIVTDAVILLAVWGAYKLVVLSNVAILVPFVVLFVLLAMVSLKNCFTITWEQHIIIGVEKIFPALVNSTKDGFRHFFMTFSGYFVSLVFAIAFNGLLAFLTFGVGLVISAPVTILYMKFLQMTAYYNWNNRRYYLDGHRIVTPGEKELTDKLE